MPKRLTTAATPARLSEVWKGGLDMLPAEEVFQGLASHLKGEAVVDLQRRLQPALTIWLQRWDTDDGELEPEEPLSGDEVDIADELPTSAKRALCTSLPAEIKRPSDNYPKHMWPAGVSQGEVDFNKLARRFLETCAWTLESKGDIQFKPQQRAVQLLMHPSSPVQRLLADHCTGSGKTLEMIRALDNFTTPRREKSLYFQRML